jgi:hypothetical protein
MEVKRLSETPVDNYEPIEYTSTLKHNCEVSKSCKMGVILVSFFTFSRRSYFHFIGLQISSVVEPSLSNNVKCCYVFVHLFLCRGIFYICVSLRTKARVFCVQFWRLMYFSTYPNVYNIQIRNQSRP